MRKQSICAVIPAAGEGKRLGLDLPKFLVPITKEKTTWDILYEKLNPLVDHIHLVLSQKGTDLFQKNYNGRFFKKVTTSIQKTPRGMGDAIFGAFKHWKNFRHVLIIWGDQVYVSSQTLKSTVQAQKYCDQSALTLPVSTMTNLYVQYVFSEDFARLADIRQSREGEMCDEKGFADVGVFCLSARTLKENWKKYLKKDSFGIKTGEVNFLPFLVFLSQEAKWKLNIIQVKDATESRGINTKEDLRFFRKKMTSLNG